MTTAVIGIGNIGGTVARDLASGGEPLVLSAVNPDDLAKLVAEIGSRATAASSNRDAVQRADTIVLALWLGPMKTVRRRGGKRLASERDEVRQGVRNAAGATSPVELASSANGGGPLLHCRRCWGGERGRAPDPDCRLRAD
jgi:predicted dinucleotide-binding enzyme